MKNSLAFLGLTLLLAPGACRPADDASAGEKKTPLAPTPAADTLYAFAAPDGRYGFRNGRGAVVLPPAYALVTEDTFARPITFVVARNAYVAIDKTGAERLRPFVYDNGPDYVQEGLFRFTEGGKIGFADRGGTKVIPAAFDFAFPFSNGRAAFCVGCRPRPDGEHTAVVGGRWGYLDRRGRAVVPPRYAQAASFDSGRAEVWLGARRLVVDTLGRPVEGAR